MRLTDYLDAGDASTKMRQGVQYRDEDAAQKQAEAIQDAIAKVNKRLPENEDDPSVEEFAKKHPRFARSIGVKAVKMGKGEFVQEHKRLVKVLRQGTKEEREKEARDQAKELSHIAADQGTIAVDFDGTLSHYTQFMGPMVLGKPIPRMVKKVRAAIKAGKKVVIFTARVAHDEDGSIAKLIQLWCKRYLGQALPVTNKKTPDITELWDDRARRVRQNQGVFADGGINWTSPGAPSGPDYYELYYNINPLVQDHPPSLKNPIDTKKPMPQDGWHKGDSEKARKQAEKDLRVIHRKLRRQFGKPEVADTAQYPIYPNFRQELP